MADFRGWPEEFQRFFIGLELDNSKKYFEANRRTYEESVKGPMVALLESLEPEFGAGKVFRANRDIRFSKDKSPYKTNIAADLGMGGPGGYLSLDARGLTVAAGRYMLSPEELAEFRKKVAAEVSGAQLAGIVAKLQRSGYQIGGEELKRVPAGWPQDHPRAALLRRKGLYAWKNFGLQPWLGTATALKHVVKVWTDARPLSEWFSRYL
jgi:uncharacterized protein (TIGR02453 family)